MSRTCQITKKSAMSGHKISHSQVKTNRRFNLNVHTKKLLNPATGKMMVVKLSVAALRTLKKWQVAGKHYDLRKLVK